jgi:hypothetical protein
MTALPSQAGELLLSAKQLTSIDIDDYEIAEPLERLLVSLNTEAELSEDGAAEMERRVLRILCNRLRMLRDFQRHPEIDRQPIGKPVFITGTARTGSTKLHKALAATGRFIHLQAWQGHTLALRSGARDEDPGPRMKDTEQDYRVLDERAPKAKLTHHYQPYEPEEETIVLEHKLYAPMFAALAFVPGYVQWYLMRDPLEDLEFLKKALKYLQWQFHAGDSRPWILKCPAYPGMEPLLARVFPGSVFIVTHRDPVSVVSSGASLWSFFHQAFSDADQRRVLGPMLLEALAMGLDRQMAVRDENPDLPIIDVSYSTLTKDTEKVLAAVFAHAGLDFGSAERQAVQAWEKNNRQHKHGEHRYSIDDFGTTEDQVRRRMSRYITRFGGNF